MRACNGRGVVTPDVAQQAGALPYRQRQHDRKESCSKHVMLAIHEARAAPARRGGDRGNPSRFQRLAAAGQSDLRNFTRWCRKLPGAMLGEPTKPHRPRRALVSHERVVAADGRRSDVVQLSVRYHIDGEPVTEGPSNMMTPALRGGAQVTAAAASGLGARTRKCRDSAWSIR